MKPVQMNVTVTSEEIAGIAEQIQVSLAQRIAGVVEGAVSQAIEKFAHDISKPIPNTDNSGAVTASERG